MSNIVLHKSAINRKRMIVLSDVVESSGKGT